MILFTIAYLAGVLTILSPCILPVLPFVFSRAGQPFARSVLPMLVGMVLTFSGVATLAALGGDWAVNANVAGRYAAIAVLAGFGVTVLSARGRGPVHSSGVALGSRLSQRVAGQQPSVGASSPSRCCNGLLWAPCAGPIPGPGADRRRPSWCQCRDHASAGGLCCRRGDFARLGRSCRGESVRGDEALTRPWRAAPAGPRHCRTCRRLPQCAGLRYGAACAPLLCKPPQPWSSAPRPCTGRSRRGEGERVNGRDGERPAYRSDLPVEACSRRWTAPSSGSTRSL